MGEPGAMVVRESGRVGVLPSGELAVFDAAGECVECCGGGGGGGPTGLCGCHPVVYAGGGVGGRCGVPRALAGLPGWGLRFVGEVTYAERVDDVTFGVVRSNVAQQTRAFDFVQVVGGSEAGVCEGQVIIPAAERIVFTQSAPAGPNRYGSPDFRAEIGAGNWSAIQTRNNPWNVPVSERSVLARVGPYAYTPMQTPSMYVRALGSQAGVTLGSQATVIRDRLAATWTGDEDQVGGGGEAFVQATVEGARSAAELADEYESAFVLRGVSGTLGRRREACLYVVEREIAVSYSGRRGVNQVIETSVEFAARWRVEMAMIGCVDGVVDPRVKDLAEQGLRACRGCGG